MNGMDDVTRPDGLNPGLDSQQALPPRPAPWKAAGAWNIPDVSPENSADRARPLAALVSFHYLRAAVRRRRLRWLVPAVLGLLFAVAFLVANPALPTATTTLLLTHDANVEPQAAMATDVSLLTTRGVAERTIADLGLKLADGQLLDSLMPVETGSTEVLQVSMTGPTPAEAIRRLNTFADEYLKFRNDQVTSRSTVLIQGYNKNIQDLQRQLQAVTKEIASLPLSSDTTTDRIADASKLSDQIGTLQAERQEALIQQSAVVNASRVIDPAAPAKSGGLRRVATILATGLIGGAALGFVVVVLQALLSDRLWLRLEVASALNTRVLLSGRRLAPLPRLARVVGFLPKVKAAAARRRTDRQRMASAIVQSVPGGGRRQSVAVLCLGNSDEMRYALLTAAASLREHGRTATVVDLTESGRVAAAAARLARTQGGERPEVFRPNVIPSLTRGPADLDAANWDEVAVAKARNGVLLVIADLDPDVGVDHLAPWTDNALVAVTAGRTSVELVRTTADLVRAAGLHLEGALLLGAVRDDMSSGRSTSPAAQELEAPAVIATRPDKGAGRSLLP